MPPILASFLTLGFIAFLLRRESRKKPNVTNALWLPTIWLLLNSSRYVSEWFSLFGISIGAASLEDGSPVDALVYLSLLVGGFRVLVKRQVRLPAVIQSNKCVTLFLIFCFLAITWSDFPFVSFKRWIKVLGNPIMALVLLTEPDLEEALTILMKRCAFVLLPVSILFIKYYPGWGRMFSPWTGDASNTGITTNKNILGCDCMIIGLFFISYLLRIRKSLTGKEKREELLLCAGILYMTWWNLDMAHSSSSMGALVIGIAILLVLGIRALDPRLIWVYTIVALVLFGALEVSIGLSTIVVEVLGRDATLTGRTDLWSDVLQVPINPLLGAGFESFWLGPRREALWEVHTFRPNQAHNGYLETYLNLGIIGLVLLVAQIISGFNKAAKCLVVNLDLGRYRLACFGAILVYNWTEATFKAVHPVWFLFYLVSLEAPRQHAVEEDESLQLPDGESPILTSART